MREFTDSDLVLHIEGAVNSLKNLLYSFYKVNRKRVVLISYWIKDYVEYIRKEDQFIVPKHKYNRGEIVQVNFGYRIGRELGGRHFAVVVDKQNSMKSEIVTVLPLTSKKKTTKMKKYSFELKTGLYELHRKKFMKLCEQEEKLTKEIECILAGEEISENDKKHVISLLKDANLGLEELKILKKSIEKLKSGTIVNVSQITTVSKMRILNPKQSGDSLNGIKLTEEDLDTLNMYLKNLYLY